MRNNFNEFNFSYTQLKEDKRRQRDFQNLVEEITNDVMKQLI